ncbi:hypothetical protein SAMN05661080_01704 [Modestobacter sp. DSM 44400]|uniref:DUF5947 family protein n=1 Tax=Modestobacter sp. DSM 44400 TaxID=1550230 RepID=UPI000899ED81|nr:DUF5947 family protein [Modestobacter sp. DSM 44400]SDX91502.1 hypothetical protein SAMN05661080_01704 [Modestobacter sp. DSM 44400]
MTGPGRSGVPLAALRRIARNRPAPVVGERCEMCAESIAATHSHVVNLDSRALMCTCRACYLLFTDQDAHLRYRAVPERYLRFPGLPLDARAWDELQIPVGLAFLFQNSVQRRTIAFYPSPAGATESDLPLDAWDRIVEHNPELGVLRPDVEALLVRRDDGTSGSCYLVPIDACYELVGRLRMLWRGFDGGSEVHEAMDAFFAQVQVRSRPAPSVGAVPEPAP